MEDKEIYKRKIMEMVEKISRVWILNLIVEFIETVTK